MTIDLVCSLFVCFSDLRVRFFKRNEKKEKEKKRIKEGTKEMDKIPMQ
jgi:hypothetical protein